jgi:hypothetical protein
VIRPTPRHVHGGSSCSARAQRAWPEWRCHYSLFPQSTLCANYFCGVLSETYPNRLVLYSGTSGGNTSNDINNGTLSYPCVLDLLSGHGITVKNYNFHCPSNYSILALFKKWATGLLRAQFGTEVH